MNALVVFHGKGRHWLAPLLKKGFSHVAVVLPVGDYWVVIDPHMGTPEVSIPTGTTYDIAAFYRDAGWLVVEVEVRELEAFGPLMINNCVGMVKKFLGIRKPLIITPYQLYKHLKGRA